MTSDAIEVVVELVAENPGLGGDEIADLVADRGADPDAVQSLLEDAPDPVVRDAFRELTKEDHADQGGNDAQDVQDLKQARDRLLKRWLPYYQNTLVHPEDQGHQQSSTPDRTDHPNVRGH